MSEDTTYDDPLLTVEEVARRLRVEATTIRRWIQSGTLHAVPLPHKNERTSYRIRQSEVNKILNTPAFRQSRPS